LKKNPITVTISLSSELFDELEDLRNAVPRSSFYRLLIIRGKKGGNFYLQESKKRRISSQKLVPNGPSDLNGFERTEEFEI
jgi:hypothetical protein